MLSSGDMSFPTRELVLLILQFLDEEKFKKTVHELEQESAFFFNMKYFEDQVQAGELDEVERYLSGFTKVEDNHYSTKIFFEIRKRKYLEALDRNDRVKAAEILVKDLKAFSTYNEEVFKEFAQLLTLDNFRQNEKLSNYGDTRSARKILLSDLKMLIERNPLFHGKLALPTFEASRLRTLIDQSLNSQHQLCNNPHPNPDIKTLFTDHTCTPPPTKGPLTGPVPRAGVFPVGAHVPVAGTNQSVPHGKDDLPKIVVRMLNQGSNVMSMDYNPEQQNLLLVGTNVGDVSIWDVGSQERLKHETFKVWNISAGSMPLKTTLMEDATISVNRCIWGPDGAIFGVAFSKHIVQTYIYNQGGKLQQHVEIDAHIGGVNDIAFALPHSELCIITCGDDKIIKVWDALQGHIRYTFEGHEAPVYSVCPHYKQGTQFIFSTAIDGKIKAWLFDWLGSIVNIDPPGLWSTTMAYSADGTRLFSCGTSKDGESHLVEWKENEGTIKRKYSGLGKHSASIVQFDTARNCYLAAGDEFQIKFWDMNKNCLLAVTDAGGGLPPSPRLRFNKEGSLLAVSTSDNGIKILANADGQRMLSILESRVLKGSRPDSIEVKPSVVGALGSICKVEQRQISFGTDATVENSKVADIKPRILDSVYTSIIWKPPDIVDSVHLKALRLPDPMAASKVMRLIYTNSGLTLLALASNAVHKLWKWQHNELNPSGKSSASIVPVLWRPTNGALMSNDISETKPAEESAACIALSKNGCYLLSASGGKVSLFNMVSFKVATSFMPPPPAATFLAFHPQDNNIIAIGMEDSTIQIYNARIGEVIAKLKGHQKQITGLAFSQTLNVLVSSAADAQLCVWSIDRWKKSKARPIQAPLGHSSSLVGETKVQFHNDQLHLLVVHERSIAIYDRQLICIKVWSPRDSLSAAISSAIYSCDGLLLITGFIDGAVGVFDADSLSLRCRVAPSAYISSSIPSGNSVAYPYPLVVAAHPSDPKQFALGMSDGSVYVIEPSDGDPTWGPSDFKKNVALLSIPSNIAVKNKPSETLSR